MAFLPIYKGRGANKVVVAKALVDDDLLPHLQHLELRYRGKYPAARVRYPAGNAETKYLHYIVWELAGQSPVPAGRFLDHVNNDLNDSRLANLSVVDGSVKNANAPRRSDASTGYKNVQHTRGKYEAKIGYGQERLYVGTYGIAAEAAHAVNYAYQVLYPEIPTPNQIPPRLLTDQQKKQVEDNVMRLLHPRRPPRKQSAN